MKNSSNILALFDFDGTITNKDSLFDFIIYSKGLLSFIIGIFLLFPFLLLYKLNLLRNDKAKEMVLRYFFKNTSQLNFTKVAEEYSLNRIDKITRTKAIEKLNFHKVNGHKVVIVSASIDSWIRPWCIKNQFDLVATKLEVKNGYLTGNLLTKNCYGPEKVIRIKEIYNLENYKYIYAYGDSRGDNEMLEIANSKNLNIF
ncbi:MAG: hypothetical protein CBE33_04220 [Candidatus Pelagibacter sp. TMED273]|nr:MAG: hypothetical protein CBE33_04220 [Candidatus Pelagibacter sp. TMED273]|tara:strand:+ start:6743 stop:7342 length:600 start_codon:yes stop_codon:yes gene_type:complete